MSRRGQYVKISHMSMETLRSIDELLQERDELLCKGIEMTNKFAELDQDAVIKYDIPDTESFNAKILPWMKLRDQCVLWHCDIFNLVHQFKIDLPIWCDLLCAPRAFDIQGLGAGGSDSANVLGQIGYQLNKGLEVLKKIDEQAPKWSEDSTRRASPYIYNIYFKKLENEQDQEINYVLNGGFERIREATNKGYWEKLYKLARDHSIVLDTPQAKQLKDYFNSERSQLYSNHEFVKKPLLKVQRNKIVRFTENIHVEIIPAREWVRRVNKVKAAVKIHGKELVGRVPGKSHAEKKTHRKMHHVSKRKN